MTNVSQLQSLANQIRRQVIEMAVPKVTHHLGSCLSIVEILTVLYFSELKLDPQKPKSLNRDIFILSKGHAGAALYATLAKKGFFDQAELTKFDQDGGISEHSTYGLPGIEISTGSLGHGLPVGLGFATSFLNDQKSNQVYVLMSDGELNEGSNWEALAFAARHQLHNVTAIVDHNSLQGYGKTREVLHLEPFADKFQAFGWDSFEVNGHSIEELLEVFTKIKKANAKKPKIIIAKTIKGKGLGELEDRLESHYHSLDENTKQQILHHLPT